MNLALLVFRTTLSSSFGCLLPCPPATTFRHSSAHRRQTSFGIQRRHIATTRKINGGSRSIWATGLTPTAIPGMRGICAI